MPPSSRSQNNLLLAALPDSVRQRWLLQREWVFMPLGQVLHESGQLLGDVYFPVTAMVALICVTKSGASSGVASIGCEGLVGVEAFMGGHSMPCRAVVQSEGYGFRLSAALVQKEFDSNRSTMHLLLRYTDALLSQIGQLAVCSRHHSLEQRLSRWLLWQFDHLHASAISATHERIANLLGVRRESVSESLSNLQNRGAIRYCRGHISVESRQLLERQSCECAHVIKRAYEHLPNGDAGIVAKPLADTVVAAAAPHRRWREAVLA
jgi:CRP-like cAMP-binding protein